MTRRAPIAAMLLCCILVAGRQTADAGSEKDWTEDETIYVSLKLIRLISYSHINLMNEAGRGIPYDRLDKKNTGHWWEYTSPLCGPVRIARISSNTDKGIVIADGFARFNLRGAWSEYAWSGKRECILDAADLLVLATQGGGPFARLTDSDTLYFENRGLPRKRTEIE